MKKILLIAILIFIKMVLHAQTDPIREKLDSIFQHVNKTQIPTGYLKEYGAEMMPLHWYNGQLTDSNFVGNVDALRFIYDDLVTANLASNILPTSFKTAIDNLKQNNVACLAVVFGNYASLRPDALSQNLMYVSNNQIYDVAFRSQSPYLTNTLFAASPLRESFNDTVKLTYNPAVFYSNTTLTLNNIAVDFKDGQGYQSIPATGSIFKVYTDSSSTKYMDIRAQMSNGNYYYCHASADVVVHSNGSANRYTGNDPYAREIPVPQVAGEGLGGDTMQIRYSINNPTRTSGNPHLRKPLILVEGYDVSGTNNILDYISDGIGNEKKGEWVQLATEYNFIHDLDDVGGYDLVYVNYQTLRSFEDNSKMLQHVIEWIKADKTAGGYNTPNVMIGVSEGGVLSRYTLARMTKTISSASTDTRLLITQDGPHQGANVPLAFQHFLYDLGEQTVLGNKIKDNKEDLKQFYALNLAPATAQLLKARVVSQGVVVLNTFLVGPGNPYHAMVTFAPTDNQPMYTFEATAQGSQCGIPVLPADGTSLADCDNVFSIANFKYLGIPLLAKNQYYLKTQLNALPATGTSQIEYFKYSKRFSYWGIGFGTKIINEYSRINPVGFTQWDAAPGSTQSIKDRAKGSLSTGLETQKLPHWYYYAFVSLKAGLNVHVSQDLFSFVSTISALDAPQGTPLNSSFIFPVTGTSLSSSAKYIAQEGFVDNGQNLYNKNHTDFTARNALWIFKEMENITQQYDCQYECPIVYNTNISGPDIICNFGVYSITNLNGLQVAGVSVSPLSIATIVLNSDNTITINALPNASGYVTISLSVKIPGCNAASPITKQIYVGKPQPVTSITESQTIGSNCAITRNFSLKNNGTGISYTWFSACISPTPTAYINSGTGTIKSLYQLNPCDDIEGQFKIRVDATNTCGTTTGTLEKIIDFNNTIQYDYDCQHPPVNNTDYYFITISPNPVTTSTIIKLKYLPPPNPPVPAPSNLMTKLMLYNGANQLVTSIQLSNVSQYELNTSFLTPGSYRLLVQSSSGEWLQATLIK